MILNFIILLNAYGSKLQFEKSKYCLCGELKQTEKNVSHQRELLHVTNTSVIYYNDLYL